MTEKRKTYRITIGGKDYTVGGEDDPQKIRKISDIISQKVAQLGGLKKYNHETRSAMMQINLAEDLVDLREKFNDQMIANEKLEQEIYELKQELISIRMDNQKKDSAAELLKKEKEELMLQITRLEAGSGKSSSSNRK